MNETSKRKEWVKNVAIIFLVVLLILTFFSNTIMNYSLPEVAVQYCSSGSITNKVRGTGTVESAEPYSVVYKETRKIAEVKAKVGDEIKKGDVLYKLEEGESAELKEAAATLKSAKTEYEKAIVDGGYSEAETKAIEEGEKDEKNTDQTKAAALRQAKEAAQNAYDAIQDEIEDFKYYTYDKWNDGTSEERKQLDDTIEAAEETRDYWKDIVDDTASDYKEYKELLDDYNNKEELYKQAKEAYEKKQTEARKQKKTEAKKARDDAKSALDASTAKAGYETYCAAYGTYTVAVETIKECNKKIKERKEELEDILIAYQDKEYAARKKSEAASKALEDFQSGYTGSNSLSELYAAYKEAQTNYDKISESVSNLEILSPVTGTVLSLAKVAGETTEVGEEIASVQLAGKGYTLSFNVTNDQAKYLSVGDEAEVSNSWWYTDVHAKITSIRTDPSDPTSGKKVTFELDGEVTNGQSLTLVAGKKTANYDYIVPNSAIREDNSGKFVLKIKSKSTPLGDRYIAERVDVTVLAEDDTQSAVSGLFEGWEYVITTSSQPVEEGKQVRLKEN